MINLTKDELISLLEALDCWRGKVYDKATNYDDLVEKISNNLKSEYNFNTNVYKDEETNNHYLISISDFGRDPEEVEYERRIRKYKKDNNLITLLDAKESIKDFLDDYFKCSYLYSNITDELYNKIKEDIYYIETAFNNSSLLPPFIKISIITYIEENILCTKILFINRDTVLDSNVILKDEELKSTYLKQDEFYKVIDELRRKFSVYN